MIEGRFSVRSGKEFEGIRYSEGMEAYIVPFIFAKVNRPAVQRSNALAPEMYGKDFVYREGIKVPNIPAAFVTKFVGTLFDVVTEYSFLQGILAPSLKRTQSVFNSRGDADDGAETGDRTES